MDLLLRWSDLLEPSSLSIVSSAICCSQREVKIIWMQMDTSVRGPTASSNRSRNAFSSLWFLLFWACPCAVHYSGSLNKSNIYAFFSQVWKPIFVSKIPKGKLPFRGRVPTTCASSPIIISSLGLHSLVKYSVLTFTSKTLFLLILQKKSWDWLRVDMPSPPTEYMRQDNFLHTFNLAQCLEREITVKLLTGLFGTRWQHN